MTRYTDYYIFVDMVSSLGKMLNKGLIKDWGMDYHSTHNYISIYKKVF